MEVIYWLAKSKVDDQYVSPPRSIWTIWNYLKRIGFRSTVNKIKSRLHEGKRNSKYCGVGFGRILATGSDAISEVGEEVVFFAPIFNPDWKCVCIDEGFTISADRVKNEVSVQVSKSVTLPNSLFSFAGISQFSGVEYAHADVQSQLLDFASKQTMPVQPSVTEAGDVFSITKWSLNDHKGLAHNVNGSVLFGLGNYAKTILLPNLSSKMELRRVHEIDPDQLSYLNDRDDLTLTTSATPLDDTKFKAWFIAGYHHTHTDLAIAAIEQGAVPVIEKPLATTRSQLNAFSASLEMHKDARFFICFHKRYSDLNHLVTRDIDCQDDRGIDMHCIVHEIPLPSGHWYNWPSSGSRLISNGCHWIDYFLQLNNNEEVLEQKVWSARGTDVVVNLRLRNDAYFSMVLTDNGSSRVGVRDHVELRQGDVTIKMVDSSHYVAENSKRVIRKTTVNPLKAYKKMYGTILSAIENGGAGDSFRSLQSTLVTIELEEELQRRI